MAGTGRGSNNSQRLDALPWSRWHTRPVVALGITWLLDGLEGSLGGSLAGALRSHEGLSLTDAQLGLSSSVYLAGAVLGSIVFGALADRFGRRKLFFLTCSDIWLRRLHGDIRLLFAFPQALRLSCACADSFPED